MEFDPALFEFTKEEKDLLRQRHASQQALLSPYACRDEEGIREFPYRWQDEDVYLGRPCFVVDVEKIVHNPFYSRCADKTQVFSLVKNDDITRRSFHLQVVSRVGRTIGMALGLNLDLIEAIAVGHDLGHTPFGHHGEHCLSSIYHARTGRYFNHNVHSVRLLRTVAQTNLCLQTYSGIISHCGEKTFNEYRPSTLSDFKQLEQLLEGCYIDESDIRNLKPNTLEGCVVRISDIIAYVGKDRQDAERVKLTSEEDYTQSPVIGKKNHQIICNVTRNIIKNSLDKDFIAMDEEVFRALDDVKNENYRVIYGSPQVQDRISFVKPMMEILYMRFIDDMQAGNEDSPIFRHHINHKLMRYDYSTDLKTRMDDIAVDYIASMTDDYFIELFEHMFPDNPLNDEVTYTNYFQ